jgi:acyl-coenzyme A synthetase/AMP-(fatty) acid ligase
MESLLNYLNQRSKDSRLVYYHGDWFTCGDLVRSAENLRIQHPEAACANVILRPENQFDAVVGVLALDGFSKNILISSDASNQIAEEIFQKELGGVVVLDLSSKAEHHGNQAVSERVDCDTIWTIPTSGTTGTPKLVQHSLESLVRAVRKDSVKGARLVWGQLYEISRFAGLQVILQALLGGSSLALSEHLAEPALLGKSFADAGVNALSATPTMWRKLLMSGALDAIELNVVTLGGEAADDLLLKQLEAKFGQSKISHIYASTEAGVGFSVTDRKAGFPEDYLERELAGGVRLRVDEDGRLFLRRSDDHTSYLGLGSAADANGWIDSEDLVERKGGRYYFKGRANGAINVGGMKVQPAEIEGVLLSHPGVAMVAVSGRSNPFMGSLVQATVVASRGWDTTSLQKELVLLCKGRLDNYKVPAVWKFADEIPMTTSGKIKRY